jgi:hypothetical protein
MEDFVVHLEQENLEMENSLIQSKRVVCYALSPDVRSWGGRSISLLVLKPLPPSLRGQPFTLQ